MIELSRHKEAAHESTGQRWTPPLFFADCCRAQPPSVSGRTQRHINTTNFTSLLPLPTKCHLRLYGKVARFHGCQSNEASPRNITVLATY